MTQYMIFFVIIMSSNINLLYIIKSYNDVVFINSDKKNVRKVMQEEDFKVQKK